MARKAKSPYKNDPKSFRVWIELEPACIQDVGEERARLANVMLERLGVGTGPHYGFKFDADSGSGYVFSVGGNHEVLPITRSGKWFDLKFLATGVTG